MGLVVKNAILIVDFTNQLKSTGHVLLKSSWLKQYKNIMANINDHIGNGIRYAPYCTGRTASEWKNGLAWVIFWGIGFFVDADRVPGSHGLLCRRQG